MAEQPIPRVPRSRRQRQLRSSTAPISTQRDQGIRTEPTGDSEGIEGDKFERPVDEFSGAQAVAGVPRWSPSADDPRPRRQLLSSTAPVGTKRDQGISPEPGGDSEGIEDDKFERPVDGAQAVAGMPRWSPSADEPRRKRRRSTPLAQILRDYLNRVELLTLVPLSMSTIDNLEKDGVFPSRFRLEPTTRVAWKRREVEKWLAQRARKRVHKAAENCHATKAALPLETLSARPFPYT